MPFVDSPRHFGWGNLHFLVLLLVYIIGASDHDLVQTVCYDLVRCSIKPLRDLGG